MKIMVLLTSVLMTFVSTFSWADVARMAKPLKSLASPFLIEIWGQDFRTALRTHNKQVLAELLDFKTIENKVLNPADPFAKENLQTARELFAANKTEQAIALYNKIPRGSDYWWQAVEEKGWSYFRKGDAEKAIAQSKTLLSPPFSEVVGSESYFLQSLAELKICDYKGIFTTHQLFKDKQKARLLEIQKLAETGFNDSFNEAIRTTDHFPLDKKNLSASLLHLPVLYYKDLILQSQLLRYKVSEKALELLHAEPNNLAKIANALEKTKQDSFKKLKSRMAALAALENQENQKIIQKLNLIEIEAIQRIHTDLALPQELYSKGTFKEVSSDKLVFMDDGHPWIDELDKFEVSAKACPQNLRRKM